MNGVVSTKRDGMLRFRLQGQVHFLRARIKGVADELTPARYLVAVTLTRFTDANTGFSSEIGTKLNDWAFGQAGGSCCS